MNDRFKFRIWNGAKYYCENNFILPSGELGFFVESMGYPHYRIFSKQENFTIEQCTGLKDKNGNLIYEGDVVRFSYFDYNGKDYHMVGVIEYAMFGLMIKGVKGEHFEEFTGYEEGAGKVYLQCWLGEFDFDPDCDFEIIGNIHDKEKA